MKLNPLSAGIAASVLAMTSIASASAAEGSAALDIAKEYLSAYSTFKVDNMAPFLAEDAVFEDPTSVGQTPLASGFMFNGKEAIIDGLGEYASNYASFSVSYDIERMYESAGNVVFIAQLTYQGANKDGAEFSGTSPIVTVIKVEGGKVARHTDYYDYRGNAVEVSGD